MPGTRNFNERHGGAVGSALGIGSKHPSSKLGRDNCVEALSPHRVTAVGKLLTLNCLGGDWPSFTFILTLLSSDCGLSVVSNKRILLLILLLIHRIGQSVLSKPDDQVQYTSIGSLSGYGWPRNLVYVHIS